MTLESLRKQIDSVDKELIKVLAKRDVIALKIRKIKEEKLMVIHDLAREKYKLNQTKKLAKEFGIDEELACNIMKLIMARCRKSKIKK